MKVLVVGSGAREHAIAWKVCQSPLLKTLVLAPGNDGMLASEKITLEKWNFGGAKSEFAELAERSKQAGVDLAIIGPDNPLADGIVDVFVAAGIKTFGPSSNAAQIEASKSFAKDIMKKAGVPTAEYRTVESLDEARALIKSVPWPKEVAKNPIDRKGWVVKADGLALGKGVIVCHQAEEAIEAVEKLFPISGKLVIEEYLPGEELSWMAFCDGEDCALMDPARDYKPLLDGNKGPNTGGMGCYSPVVEVQSDEFFDRVRQEVFEPVVRAMKDEGCPFVGNLYAGLMFHPATKTLKVLEFNARMGDPETEVLFPRVHGDLLEWFMAAAEGNLRSLGRRVPFKAESAVYLVAASEGYPEKPIKGRAVIMPELTDSLTCEKPRVFFAGVKKGQAGFETSGGRVLGVIGYGDDLEQARSDAYSLIDQYSFEGAFYRGDIAKRDLN